MSLVEAIIFSGGKAGGGGGGVTPPPSPDDYIPVGVGDSPITLVSGSRYSFNTSGGPITANLPATPTQGYAVYVYFDSVSDLNPVTFNAGSETIEGGSSLIAGAAYNGLFYTIAWNETESDWKATQTSNTDGSSGGSSVGESSIVAIRALTKLISGADVQDFSTGNWYEYDAGETVADDGISYLTPNSIIEPAPGRWVLVRIPHRNNVVELVTVDAQTSIIDFDLSKVVTKTFANLLTTHVIAVSNLSTTERYNTLVIDNSANTTGLTVTFNDQTGAITYRNAKNEFPGIYPNMNISAGSIWEVSFENRSAILTVVSFDEMEDN